MTRIPAEIAQQIATYVTNRELTLFGQTCRAMPKALAPEKAQRLRKLVDSFKLVVSPEYSLLATSDRVYICGRYAGKQQLIPLEALHLPEGIAKINDKFVLTHSGKVYVHGDNNSSELGMSSLYVHAYTELTTIPEKVVDISRGKFYTLFLTEHGKVYACGDNSYGQLGPGITANKQLIPQQMALDEKAVGIIALDYCSYIMTENGNMYGFGQESYHDSVEAYGDWITTTPRIPNVKGIAQVLHTESSIYFMANDGRVFLNEYDPQRAEKLAESLLLELPGKATAMFRAYSMAFFQLASGEMWYRKDKQLMQLSEIPGPIKSIVGGNNKIMILTQAGEVYVKGRNWTGELGTTADTSETFVKLDFKQPIVQIGTSGLSSIFLTADGQFYTCGENDTGQLGLGDTNDRSKPTLMQSELFQADFYQQLNYFDKLQSVVKETDDDDIYFNPPTEVNHSVPG